MSRVECVLFIQEPAPDGAEYKLQFRNAKTGQVCDYAGLPEGAMWFRHKRDEYNGMGFGIDGKTLMVKMPGGGIWNIDSRANNCTLPDDNEHRCWCRHGEAPIITVDKVGLTCQAGAGSILMHTGYHGFLREGFLEA